MKELTHCPKCYNRLTRIKKIDEFKNLDVKNLDAKIKKYLSKSHMFLEYDSCLSCGYSRYYDHYKIFPHQFINEHVLKLI